MLLSYTPGTQGPKWYDSGSWKVPFWKQKDTQNEVTLEAGPDYLKLQLIIFLLQTLSYKAYYSLF